MVGGILRDIKVSQFEQYISKYRYTEAEQVERRELIKPGVSMSAAKQMASGNLTGQAVNVFDIQDEPIAL